MRHEASRPIMGMAWSTTRDVDEVLATAGDFLRLERVARSAA
jgi:hypothetical protein